MLGCVPARCIRCLAGWGVWI